MKRRPSSLPNSSATDFSVLPLRLSLGRSVFTYPSNSSFVAEILCSSANWRTSAWRNTSLRVRGCDQMEYSFAGLLGPVSGSPAHIRRSLSCIETATRKSAFVKFFPLTRRNTSFFAKSDIRRSVSPTYSPGALVSSEGAQPARSRASKANPENATLFFTGETA